MILLGFEMKSLNSLIWNVECDDDDEKNLKAKWIKSMSKSAQLIGIHNISSFYNFFSIIESSKLIIKIQSEKVYFQMHKSLKLVI